MKASLFAPDGRKTKRAEVKPDDQFMRKEESP
jgi:hypothetical protein